MSKRATVGLALLALFFGGAFAQQPAALYGIIDVGVQWNKQYASSTNQQASVWSIDIRTSRMADKGSLSMSVLSVWALIVFAMSVPP